MMKKTGRFLVCSTLVVLGACDRFSIGGSNNTRGELSPPFRNVGTATGYVGDDACTPCHEEAASVYQGHAMAQSFHGWTPDGRMEGPLEEPLFNEPTGFYYSVVETDGQLYQEEFLVGPDGNRLHELRRRIDYVMGSGNVARTYFTEENGRLFQLPLTWYSQQGWDFSPGYEVNNARFDRLMPDRCIACHGSYPQSIPFLEGKYEELRPGIGCERCHGPGALHVNERSQTEAPDSTYDDTIVNPKHLPFERRLDVCDQCHVHTPVTVLRAGQDAFSYVPSQPLQEHAAFFKATGSIDIVSHADRLRQSACFVGTRSTERPLECATCHNPHLPVPHADMQNQPCLGCHDPATLEDALSSSEARDNHAATANCVGCHMPQVKERTVPHGTFTEHWIRVVSPESQSPRPKAAGESPVEPYFERDRNGVEADIYRGMGEVVYATMAADAGLLRRGADALQRALRADPTRGDAHFLLGLAYQQLARTEDAIQALELSISADPDRPQRLHALAQAYERGTRDPDSIARLYERALELQPALAWIRADYADFLREQGRAAAAETEYRAALNERPSLDVAWFNFGTLLTGLGRLADATEAFGRAVGLNPMLAEAVAFLVEFQVMEDSIVGARMLGSPLENLPVRYRGLNTVEVIVSPTGDGVLFVNVQSGASVRILQPDGSPVRTLPAQRRPTVRWNLRNDGGVPIAGGLYQVLVRGQDGSNRAVPAQRMLLGIVRAQRP